MDLPHHEVTLHVAYVDNDPTLNIAFPPFNEAALETEDFDTISRLLCSDDEREVLCGIVSRDVARTAVSEELHQKALVAEAMVTWSMATTSEKYVCNTIGMEPFACALTNRIRMQFAIRNDRSIVIPDLHEYPRYFLPNEISQWRGFSVYAMECVILVPGIAES